MNKTILISLFCIMCLVQLSVPAKMIFDSNKVLTEGKAYKFKTAPIDPTDPFRGKYVTLDYEKNYFDIQNQDEWIEGQEVYVSFAEDTLGYAYISRVDVSIPDGENYSLLLKIDRVSKSTEENRIYFRYPFDRLYLEESKAPLAEELYRNAQRDSSIVYAKVSILNGNAVLNDVFVNEVPIKDLIKQ